jgi:hypothetical protein
MSSSRRSRCLHKRATPGPDRPAFAIKTNFSVPSTISNLKISPLIHVPSLSRAFEKRTKCIFENFAKSIQTPLTDIFTRPNNRRHHSPLLPPRLPPSPTTTTPTPQTTTITTTMTRTTERQRVVNAVNKTPRVLFFSF